MILFSKNNLEYEEYCQDIGRIGPVEEYLTLMFSSVLQKKEKTYIGINLGICEELKNKKITPAEYMIKEFDFFRQFEENETVKQKEALLIKIKELSFGIYEDIVAKIRSIGRKYEVE